METEIKATAMAKVEKRINFKDIVSVSGAMIDNVSNRLR